MMGVSPQYVGRYGRPWVINLNTDSGTDNISGLLASAITVTLRNLSATPPVDAVSTGTITIAGANPAQIIWQPTANDFVSHGSFEAIVTVTFSTGPIDYDPIPFTILSR
jgi:hypothetical protein